MGWIQKLFGNSSDQSQVVVLETGDAGSDQAVCLKLDGAYIIDLRPLSPDPERVLRALEQLTAKIEQSPQAIQVWVASTRLLEAYSGAADKLSKLVDALFAATQRVQPKMIVQNDAPEDVVYLLRSLGFEVFLPGLRLTTVDSKGRASEIDVMKELARISNAPRLRV